MTYSKPILGLDIGGTNVRAALIRGSEVTAIRGATWPADLSPEEEVGFVADQALAVVGEARLTARAAGVSLAALLTKKGVVAHWPNRPNWRGLAFRSLLEARLGMPIVIEDDANAAAMAEWAYGSGRGYRQLLVVMVGTGVGAGLILDGRLYRGGFGWAGELGHVTVSPDGPPCPCGKHGCLQTLASGRALERVATDRGLGAASAVTAAAELGEEWAQHALADCGRQLGLALANAVNLLDLEAVVVGGGLSVLGQTWWTGLERALRANLINRDHREVALLRAKLPDTAGLIGAALLARKTTGVWGPDGVRAHG